MTAGHRPIKSLGDLRAALLPHSNGSSEELDHSAPPFDAFGGLGNADKIELTNKIKPDKHFN